MKLSAYFHMKWKDEIHKWDHDERLKCVPLMVIPDGPDSGIWVPKIAVTNTDLALDTTKPVSGHLVQIRSDGTSSFSDHGIFEFQCKFDFTVFPFDSHRCVITIDPIRYPSEQQLLIPRHFTFFRQFMEHDEWHLSLGEISQQEYSFSNRTFSALDFQVVIQRKALYHLVVLVVPFFFIATVEASTFSLPINSPDRLQLSFTCLLAFSFFQTIIVNDLPHSSDNIPLLLVFVTLLIILVCLVILSQSFVIYYVRRINKCKNTQRKWRHRCSSSWKSRSRLRTYSHVTNEQMELYRFLPGIQLNQNVLYKRRLSWASSINRYSMVIFISSLIISTLAIFIFIPLMFPRVS